MINLLSRKFNFLSQLDQCWKEYLLNFPLLITMIRLANQKGATIIQCVVANSQKSKLQIMQLCRFAFFGSSVKQPRLKFKLVEFQLWLRLLLQKNVPNFSLVLSLRQELLRDTNTCNQICTSSKLGKHVLQPKWMTAFFPKSSSRYEVYTKVVFCRGNVAFITETLHKICQKWLSDNCSQLFADIFVGHINNFQRTTRPRDALKNILCGSNFLPVFILVCFLLCTWYAFKTVPANCRKFNHKKVSRICHQNFVTRRVLEGPYRAKQFHLI